MRGGGAAVAHTFRVRLRACDHPRLTQERLPHRASRARRNPPPQLLFQGIVAAPRQWPRRIPCPSHHGTVLASGAHHTEGELDIILQEQLANSLLGFEGRGATRAPGTAPGRSCETSERCRGGWPLAGRPVTWHVGRFPLVSRHLTFSAAGFSGFLMMFVFE